jgi:hypothetical protein
MDTGPFPPSDTAVYYISEFSLATLGSIAFTLPIHKIDQSRRRRMDINEAQQKYPWTVDKKNLLIPPNHRP